MKDLTELWSSWELIDNFDHEYSFIDSDGPVLYFKTNVDAPQRRVIAIDLRKPQMEFWKVIIPQTENA